MAETLRIWWGAQKARDNYGEFAGAVVRVGIGFVLLFAYYAWVDWGEQTWGGYLCWGFLAYSLVLFAWIHRSKAASDVARYLPLVVDVVTATTLLGLTGERSAIVWFVYTWTPVAYGLRFGLRYLYVSWIVSVVGCGLVYALSAAVDGFWYEHPLLWLGAFIWVAAPTVYVAILLKQKLAAVQSAEEARVQTERAQADAERERVERARAEAERARAEAEAASEAKSEFLATRSLIDNLLDLRKIEAGKMAIEHSPFDLHVVMNRLAALFEPEAKRAHLRFTKSISADAPYGLVGDDLRIQQVLINMIGNALKFTRQGFVRVSASAPEQSDHEVTLRFEVRDTGIGIPPENAGRIFDRFTQANSGIHRQYGGSGLGTTICKHLVGLMGGAIGFDSRPEGGTTFWFSVPLSRQLAEAHEDGAGVSIRGARLYLVSRSPEAGRWFARTVRERQMQYASFVSIEDALTTTPQDGNRELCIWIVDGEDDGIRWRDAPRVLGQGGAQSPCILIHPGLAENDAFDAGYVCLLKSRDPLPLVRALRSVVAGTTSVEPLADFSGQQASGRTGLRVLVAEDNQISQQIIAMMLQAGGHLVTLVSDGESVLETYRNASFDVVILDMHMPGRTGLDVARAIRLLEAASRDRRMPIIMLTAAASIDLREDSRDAGVDLFLSKPVDPRALLRGVSQVFSDADHAGTLTAPPPRAPEECIDRVLLQEMAKLARDPGFMQTLTRKFSAEARQLVDQIEAAVTGKDRARFRELTHALKGTAMMAGAIRLRDSAARAEITADSVFNGAGADLIEDLRKALEATNHELSRMLA